LLLLVLLTAFAASFIVQLYFLVFIFARLSGYRNPQHQQATLQVPVSVIVCTRNELESLQKIVPALMEQEYPDYEIIIVADRSNDTIYDYLLEQRNILDPHKFKLVYINRTPDNMNPKKYALTLGIKAAANEFILLTDVDCLPKSKQWISLLTGYFSERIDIVLGYAPYLKLTGYLNTFIRYETFYSAIQFLSLSIVGRPYMGVGRNLAYKKSLFLKNKGFHKHMHITGGDDDLFVNATAVSKNVAIYVEENGHTVSLPKESFKSWYIQKRRHLSVGKHYKPSDKAILGLLSMSHFLFWICSIALLFTKDFAYIGIAGICVKIAVQTIIFNKISKRLKEDFNWGVFPVLDFLYIFYYIIFGVPALFSKKVRWN
jgi:glycosyltransferase involved in cell wall biosynthesis